MKIIADVTAVQTLHLTPQQRLCADDDSPSVLRDMQFRLHHHRGRLLRSVHSQGSSVPARIGAGASPFSTKKWGHLLAVLCLNDPFWVVPQMRRRCVCVFGRTAFSCEIVVTDYLVGCPLWSWHRRYFQDGIGNLFWG